MPKRSLGYVQVERFVELDPVKVFQLFIMEALYEFIYYY